MLNRSREDFFLHYKQNYGLPLPIWVSVELWEFGMLSTFYQGMTVEDKTKIASKYLISDWGLMENWLRSINFVRNVAAHHCRLWNRNLIDQPKLPKPNDMPWFDPLIEKTNSARLYLVLCILSHFMHHISPHSTWSKRLVELIDHFPTVPTLSLKNMDFPSNWKTHNFWKNDYNHQ